jgi:hypothetical protein
MEFDLKKRIYSSLLSIDYEFWKFKKKLPHKLFTKEMNGLMMKMKKEIKIQDDFTKF